MKHVLDQTELVGRYTSRTSRLLTLIVGGIVVLIEAALVYRFITRRRIAPEARGLTLS